MTFGYVGADSSIAMEVGYRLDDFSVVIHTAEHDMTVRMLLVRMSDDYKWSIGNTHLLHIFMGDFEHEIIGHPWSILRRESERYVSTRVFDFVPCQGRSLDVLRRHFAPTLCVDFKSDTIAVYDAPYPFIEW